MADAYHHLTDPAATVALIESGKLDAELSDIHAAALSWGVVAVLRACRLRRAALAIAEAAPAPVVEVDE